MSSKQIAGFIAGFKNYFRPVLIANIQNEYLYKYKARNNGGLPSYEMENEFIRQLIVSQKPIHDAEKILNDFEKEILNIPQRKR